jgi:hypothetical protein
MAVSLRSKDLPSGVGNFKLAIYRLWTQTSPPMKDLSWTLRYALVTMVLVLVVACAAVVGGKHAGVIYVHDKDAIVVRPEAQLSQNDCDSIKAILPKYDKRLYRIRTYKAGKLTREKGQLDLNRIQAGLGSNISAEAKSMGFTGCSVAFGDGHNTTFMNLMPQRKDLLKSLESILRNYDIDRRAE